MIRILFVDDESAVLAALENRLRPLRHKWSMRFACGAGEAWAALEQEPCDVIVCDMRMAGMDGAELLRHVRDRHPETARIVLSGYATHDGVLRALPVAHQFLAKPCESDALEDAVEHACALRNRLGAPAVKHAIASLRVMPVLPRLYQDLSREIESPKASSGSVAAIVQQDPGMTARLLQVANSALLGARRRINHARDAVTLLGLDPVRSIVLSEQMFRAMSDLCAPPGFSLDALQQHSLSVAQIASRLLAAGEESQLAFSAGMLHDIGKLVIALGMPEAWAQVRERSAAAMPTWQVEHEVLGCSHAEIGAQMLALWGLPQELVEAVAYHHEPRLAGETRFGAAGAVHVADALAHERGPGQAHGGARGQGLDVEYLGAVGVSDRLPQWVGGFGQAA